MPSAVGTFYAPVTIGGRSPVRCPHRVGMVPRLAAGRRPRPVDDALAEAVHAGGTAVVCQVPAGLGGVGKTCFPTCCGCTARRTRKPGPPAESMSQLRDGR